MRFLEGEEEEPDADGVIFAEIEDGEFDESIHGFSLKHTHSRRFRNGFSNYLVTLIAEEEQGINILFLAMGFLQWFEDANSKVLRESPLILLPVELVRNTKASTYDIVCRDDDIVTNLSLQERLKLDFGISLPEIDDSTDWVPSDYFAQVARQFQERTW